mgnify:CR=1 FL=1
MHIAFAFTTTAFKRELAGCRLINGQIKALQFFALR